MPVDGRTILVTGGAGFVGSHLVERLVGDNDVRVLDDFSSGRREYLHRDVDVIEGDLRDDSVLERAMDGVDLVFHEAAQVSVPESIEAPVESHGVNLNGTLSLLERARDADARVVLASSCAIYGHPDSIPIAEDDPKEPTSPYGLQKLGLDHYAQLYHDLYGLETVALRYFNIYGPRQGGEYAGVIDIFLEQALSGEPITVEGDGEQTRDFVHVDDVVRANLLAAETDAVGEAYNVGTGESVTIRELAELVTDVTGSDSEITHVEPREGDIERSRADLARARDRLGFEPEVSLREGLERLVDENRR